MPPRYKSVDECRSEIQDHIEELDVGTDDGNPDKRDTVSTRRYKQDLRWFDEWLDDNDIDTVFDVTVADSSRLGRTLSKEFNGTTSLYRWDRIYAFYDWLVALELTDTNPLERWNDKKDEKWGLTKRTQQSQELGNDEKYAVAQSDVRLMEENVGRNRVRDQCIIRMLWQTGMRRGEQAELLTSDIDRDAQEIHIRVSVAKNGKERYVAYQESLEVLLERWLDGGHRYEMLGITAEEAEEGKEPHKHVFAGERGAPLSADRINKIVINAANEAGINRKMYGDANSPIDPETEERKKNRWKITAHNIRHGYGTWMINEAPGEDGQARLWEVSKQMGHSSVEITEDIYVEDDPRAGLSYAHSHGPE